jgi:hypothetical protein
MSWQHIAPLLDDIATAVQNKLLSSTAAHLMRLTLHGLKSKKKSVRMCAKNASRQSYLLGTASTAMLEQCLGTQQLMSEIL